MAITQASRNLEINTALGTDKVLILSASITEELGGMFQMEVELASTDINIPFNKIVGTNATIRMTLPAQNTQRYFNGYVSRFVQTDAHTTGGFYRATLVPWLWFLTRSSDCQIFQNKTVPDIIKAVFQAQGFSDVKDSLTGTYQPWEYCVQYRETAFNFVSRLMEHEGIYYFFEHENGKHTLVLADSSSAHTPFQGYETILYHSSRGGMLVNETIQSWTLAQQVESGVYVINDFNFTIPKTSLLAQSQSPADHPQGSWQLYDYPGEYPTHSAGTDNAKVRLEEEQADQATVQGMGNARGLATGHTFTFSGASRGDQNGAYLITAANHLLTADDYKPGGQSGSDQQELYTCSFSAILAEKAFRSERTTPKPLIQGPQTAWVVGPSGEEIYVDKYGRIKVQFHWDRHGKADENSSCFIRVSQAGVAGKGWGAMHIPRVGHEVIVEFLEGDPDRPIVTGQVYNAALMPPYELPAEQTKTTFKSNSSKGGGGFNEFRFEDKKGSEQVFLHGEKDLDIRVKNDRLENIENDRHLHVKNDKYENIDGNRHETIKLSHFEKISTDHNQDIAGKQAIHVTGSQSVKVDGDMIHQVGGNYSQVVTGTIYLSATSDLVIESAASVTIKVGSSSIAMDSSGITIAAGQIQVNATQTIQATANATVTVTGTAGVTVSSDASTTVSGDGGLTLSSPASVSITGGTVAIM